MPEPLPTGTLPTGTLPTGTLPGVPVGLVGSSRPVTLARDRLLELVPELAGLFPGGGLARGSTVAVYGCPGAMSLGLSLLAGPTAKGSWAAAVGLPHLGLAAAAEAGVHLGRLAVIPDPGQRWPTVVSSLLDGLDLVLVALPSPARPPDARRLSARARHRGSVLVVLVPGPPVPGRLRSQGSWPYMPDVSLSASAGRWQGLEDGYGYLSRRELGVVAEGRRWHPVGRP